MAQPAITTIAILHVCVCVCVFLGKLLHMCVSPYKILH